MKTQKANQIISYVSLFGYSCGDYAFAFCACLLVSFCITLTACGGGGSSITGGGNTGISGVGAVSEFRAQSGLALVSAASAYHGGHDGQSVKVGVVDSGIDASHSELAGHATGGGDWQSASNMVFTISLPEPKWTISTAITHLKIRSENQSERNESINFEIGISLKF